MLILKGRKKQNVVSSDTFSHLNGVFQPLQAGLHVRGSRHRRGTRARAQDALREWRDDVTMQHECIAGDDRAAARGHVTLQDAQQSAAHTEEDFPPFTHARLAKIFYSMRENDPISN